MQHSGALHTAAAYNVGSLSPRVKMALRALATGAITQNEAAEIGNVTPSYLSIVKHSPLGQEYLRSMENSLDEKALDTVSYLARLAREAAERMAGVMRFSDNQNLVVKAAADLMDRSSETSKTQKLQVDSYSLNSRDVKGLAEALVKAAELKTRFTEAATGNFVRVEEPVYLNPGDSVDVPRSGSPTDHDK